MWNEYFFIDKKTGRIAGEVRPHWRGYVSAFIRKPGPKIIHLGDWSSIEKACHAVRAAHQNQLSGEV